MAAPILAAVWDEADDGLYPDSGAFSSSFLNAQGLRIAVHEWPVIQPKAFVVAAHGIDVHARFQFGTSGPHGTVLYRDSWAERLNNVGVHVVAMDHEGHGASDSPIPGVRSYFERFRHVVDDMEAVVKQVQAHARGAPVFILGASFGGCVTAQVAQRLGYGVAGVVLLCAMLSVEQIKKKPINALLLPMVEYLSRWWPTLALGKKQPNVRFPQLDEFLREDQLVYNGPVRARVASENLRAMDETNDAAAAIVAPLLVVHSYADTMCDPKGSNELFAATQSSDKTYDRLDSYEGYTFWHALTAEPGNELIADTVCKWIARRCSQMHFDS